MTGEKNRFKTHERLWDIDDKQLKTPKHDALILWLMDEDNLKKVMPFPATNRIINVDGIKIQSEVPLKASPTFIGGYADLIVTAFERIEDESYESGYHVIYDKSILIEVKPYIDSFGSVLRQIKSYNSFIHKPHFLCLFTLDDRFDKQFASQGIKVVHPPKDFQIDEYLEEMGLV